jgi:hypothetical protein
VGKITVRDSLPDDPIFKEGLRIYFPRRPKPPTAPPKPATEQPDPAEPPPEASAP